MSRHRIVIIGSGFAGLTAARRLKNADADITILARTSHHLFQPLLYQVATGILSEGDIAPTTREILRGQKNVTVLQALVEEIDVEARVVKWRNHNKHEQTEYDTLIVAAGAGQSYFGNDHFAVFAPGMKTIDDALELRARIFGAFELAEIETDPAAIEKLLTESPTQLAFHIPDFLAVLEGGCTLTDGRLGFVFITSEAGTLDLPQRWSPVMRPVELATTGRC